MKNSTSSSVGPSHQTFISVKYLIKIINLGAKNCPVGRNGLITIHPGHQYGHARVNDGSQQELRRQLELTTFVPLVAHQHLDDVRLCDGAPQLVQPPLDVPEGLLLGDVVHKHDAVDPPVVAPEGNHV